jgi:hypothetical protein
MCNLPNALVSGFVQADQDKMVGCSLEWQESSTTAHKEASIAPYCSPCLACAHTRLSTAFNIQPGALTAQVAGGLHKKSL